MLMMFTIEPMPPVSFMEGRRQVSKNGYAFMDEAGSCIIIVYEESRRDDMSCYLGSPGDKFGLKYEIIKL